MNEFSVTLLSLNDKLKFKKFKQKEKVPCVAYADFECNSKKSESTCRNTHVVQIHEPCSPGHSFRNRGRAEVCAI